MRSDRRPFDDLRIVAGAELDAIDEDGRTALWLASRHSRLGATRSEFEERQNDRNGGFLKWWVSPTTMCFPTKNDHFWEFWGYHHLRKHPNHQVELNWGTHLGSLDVALVFEL